MQLTNSPNSYGWITIVLHWLIAVSVIGLFLLGDWMVTLDYYSNWYHDAPFIHKSIGILVVGAMVCRLIWNHLSPTPKTYESLQNPLAIKAIQLMHMSFYLLVVLIGVSGYMISTAEGEGISVFNWFTVPALIDPFEGQADLAGEIHKYLAYVLMGMVALHFLGALKHHLFNKDRTLKRMLKPN